VTGGLPRMHPRHRLTASASSALAQALSAAANAQDWSEEEYAAAVAEALRRTMLRLPMRPSEPAQMAVARAMDPGIHEHALTAAEAAVELAKVLSASTNYLLRDERYPDRRDPQDEEAEGEEAGS